MKFLVLQNYSPIPDVPPIMEWAEGDIREHIEFQGRFDQELTDSGELVDSQGLAGPDLAKFVVSNGGAPVVTDGPFPETKELVAGYRVVDVESEERAIEIAARLSAAPGPGGRAVGQSIEVRQIMSAPEQ